MLLICPGIVRRTYGVIPVLILTCSLSASGQVDSTNGSKTSSSASTGSSWSPGNDAETIFHDAGRIITAPARFSSEEWLTTAAVAGGTALCFAIDEPVRTYMVDHQSSFGDGINSFGQAYGSAVNALIFSGALYAGGAITGNSGV